MRKRAPARSYGEDPKRLNGTPDPMADSPEQGQPRAVEADADPAIAPAPRRGSRAVRSIASIASLVALLVIVSKSLGFLREVIIAGAFGRGIDRDAYGLAYQLPSLALVLLGGQNGPFHTATLAALTRMRAAGRKDRANAIVTLVLTSGGVMAVLGALVFVFAPAIVRIQGPWAPAQTHALAAALLRIMVPILVIGAWVGVLSGISNDRGEYGLPAISPAMTSLAIIAFVAWRHGDPLMLAIGTTVGAVAQIALQGLPALWASRTPWLKVRPMSWREPVIKEASSLLWPAILSSSIGTINAFIGTFFLSKAGNGAISSWAYANVIYQLPLGTLLSSLLVPLFPRLTAAAAREDYPALRALLDRGVAVVSLVAIPLAAGLSVLAIPIVRLAFDRGAFARTHATAPTALVLAILCLGLVAYALRDVLVRVFYAINDARTPLRVSLISISLNVVLNAIFMFVFKLGLAGIALSAALVTWANFLQIAWALQQRLKEHDPVHAASAGPILWSGRADLLKVLIAAGVAGALGRWLVLLHWPHGKLFVLAEILVVSVGGLLAYGGVLLGLGLRPDGILKRARA